MTQIKYRYDPERFPVKFTKLKDYQYFANIAKQFDSSFMRSILPYSCQIITTKCLQIQKFVYVLISPSNHPKLKGKYGFPVFFNQSSHTQTQYQLQYEATFIKINIQAHLIFQKLLNLDLGVLNLSNTSYNDKFWFFSEGELKILNFNQIAYKECQNQQEKGIYIFLDGQFRCMNNMGKNIKNIGDGFCILTNNNLIHFNKKIKFPENFTEQRIKEVAANTNNAKLLFLRKTVIKKYFPDAIFDDFPIHNKKQDKQNKNEIQLNKHKRFNTELKQINLIQLSKNKKRGSVGYGHGHNIQNKKQKFKLISNRQSNFRTKTIEQITNDQIVKQYIKDHFTYKRLPQIKRILQQKNNDYPMNKFSKKKSCQNNFNFMSSFFKQQKKDYKQSNVQNVNNSNQFCQALKTLKLIEAPSKKAQLIDQKIGSKKLNVQKSQLKALGLLKRNIMNKIYHQKYPK